MHHHNVLLLDPASDEKNVKQEVRSVQETKREEVTQICYLPDHVTWDADDVVEEAVLGEELVDDSSSSEEEPGSQVEFVGEVKHCEARIGDEAFEESFFFPPMFICQNTT